MSKKAVSKSKSEEPDSFSLFSDFDIHLFRSGKHFKLYEKLGAHLTTFKKKSGTYFAVWAPNARGVSVIGNFNSWNNNDHKLDKQNTEKQRKAAHEKTKK